MLARFLRERNAATAIEYSLIAALISLAIIGSAGSLGNALNTLWSDNTNQFQNAVD